jgi:enamine deaminase RidA (YjgF/YER057c/UK114 family)
MSGLKIVNPPALGRPRGYSHGVVAPEGSRLLFVAGQIGWNRLQQIVSEEFEAQFAQALDNLLEVVRAAGGGPEHVVRLTIFVADRDEYLLAAPEVGEAYRARFGRHYPAMSLVEVAHLLEPGARVEIEATAALPPEAPF